MTVKQVAQLANLSHQAVYKRIKANGYKVEDLKDKASGQFTPEGEKVVRELFNLSTSAEEPVDNQLSTEVEKLRNRVAELEATNKALAEERDFLRKTLDTTTEALTNAQKLQAVTLSKVPPALPSGEHGGRLRKAWDRWRRKDGHE